MLLIFKVEIASATSTLAYIISSFYSVFAASVQQLSNSHFYFSEAQNIRKCNWEYPLKQFPKDLRVVQTGCKNPSVQT